MSECDGWSRSRFLGPGVVNDNQKFSIRISVYLSACKTIYSESRRANMTETGGAIGTVARNNTLTSMAMGYCRSRVFSVLREQSKLRRAAMFYPSSAAGFF